MSERILPNTFIIGAPRCGTTSLFHWLCLHPDSCGASDKEPFYFMDKDNPFRRKKANYHDHGLTRYYDYFRHCSHDTKVVVEATTQYLYQQTAIDMLSTFKPVGTIICVLRKPSERIYSSFNFSQKNRANIDRSISFKMYVEHLLDEMNNPCQTMSNIVLPFSCWQDIKYSCYVNYISKWLDRFGSDKVHIYLLENIKKDPLSVLKDIAMKLNIDYSFFDKVALERHNEAYWVSNMLIHRWVVYCMKFFPNIPMKSSLGKVYRKIHAKKVQRSDEDRDTLMMLDAYFEPYNRELSSLLNMDLSNWK